MRPIQYPVRPSAHVTANVRVPTSDLANAGGPHKTSDERRPAIAPAPIANVRPHIGMPRYKGTMYFYVFGRSLVKYTITWYGNEKELMCRIVKLYFVV